MSANDDQCLKAAFRQLREAWFNSQLRSNAHEREWESEARGYQRACRNNALRKQYDDQTEAIISGVGGCVCPRSAHDMLK